MLEYMDDVLGRLFDFMERSKLRENTYVLVMGDNGAELYPEERKGMHRQVGWRCSCRSMMASCSLAACVM